MEQYRRSQELRKRMEELFDLPGSLTAGTAHIELLGDREFYLEGHEGILSYSAEQIDVNAGALIVRVTGRELTLRALTDCEVRIRGQITVVTLVR